jgi:Kelch motif/Galactose oxidase, central domain
MARLLVLLLLVGVGGSQAAEWKKAPPMPRPRSEVASTTFRSGIAVIGGFRGFGALSDKVEVFTPSKNRWRQLPKLPLALHHASAAASGSKLYVVGGYGQAPRFFRRAAFVWDAKRWRALTKMPASRAAAGAVVVGRKLYVVGGVTPRGLAETMLVLDLDSGSWSQATGPTPREHLGVATADGLVYAVGGRLGGPGSNVAFFEVFDPATGEWKALQPIPEARSGTGLALAGGMLVSVGGEGPDTTFDTVLGYDLAEGRWRELPDLPTPRHGLAVASVGNRVYAIGGSPVADLGFSIANEYLELTP